MPKISMPSSEAEVPEYHVDDPVQLEEEVVEAIEHTTFDDDDEAVSVEDMEPDTQLWEAGPTAGEVTAWKSQYKKVYITRVDVEDYIVWRTLKRSEYKDVVRHIEQMVSSGKFSQTEANMFNEEILCEICCLFPKFVADSFDGLAGIPSIISQQILESSGFSAIEVREV